MSESALAEQDESAHGAAFAPLISLPQWFAIVALLATWGVTLTIAFKPVSSLVHNAWTVFIILAAAGAACGLIGGLAKRRPIFCGIAGTVAGAVFAASVTWFYWQWGLDAIGSRLRTLPRFTIRYQISLLILLGCAAVYSARFILYQLKEDPKADYLWRIAMREGAKAFLLVGGPYAGACLRSNCDVGDAILDAAGVGVLLVIVGLIVGGVASTVLPRPIDWKSAWCMRRRRMTLNGLLCAAGVVTVPLTAPLVMHMVAMRQLAAHGTQFHVTGRFSQSSLATRNTAVTAISLPFAAAAEHPLLLQAMFVGRELDVQLHGEATDAILANLPYAKHVSRLEITGGTVTNAGLIGLRDCLRVERLAITDVAIDSAGVQHLPEMSRLWQLSLSGTQVDDRAKEFLVGLPHLTELSLSNTKITDAALTSIAKMPNLGVLQLSQTAVTDEGLRSLVKMRRLRLLDLRGTKVTRKGIEAFLDKRGQDVRVEWDGDDSLTVDESDAPMND